MVTMEVTEKRSTISYKVLENSENWSLEKKVIRKNDRRKNRFGKSAAGKKGQEFQFLELWYVRKKKIAVRKNRFGKIVCNRSTMTCVLFFFFKKYPSVVIGDVRQYFFFVFRRAIIPGKNYPPTRTTDSARSRWGLVRRQTSVCAGGSYLYVLNFIATICFSGGTALL